VGQRAARHIGALMALLGALVLSGILVLAGLDSGRIHAQASAAPAVVEVDDVLSQPRRYLYGQATLRGQVSRLWGQHAFTLRSHAVRQGLLIIIATKSSGEANLHVGQRVEVTGEVRPVARAELQALRPLTADVNADTLLALFSGDPYILAQEVRPAGARSAQP